MLPPAERTGLVLGPTKGLLCRGRLEQPRRPCGQPPAEAGSACVHAAVWVQDGDVVVTFLAVVLVVVVLLGVLAERRRGTLPAKPAAAAPGPAPYVSPLPVLPVRVPTTRAPTRAAADQQSPPPAALAAREVVRLSSNGRVCVVGESHYQSALSILAGGRDCRPWENAFATSATLVPEPDNPYDDNAVRVDIGGRTVGYLGRDDAASYQPVLLDMLPAAAVGCCPAFVCGGGDHFYGVFLSLGPPECLVPLVSDEGLELLPAEWLVTVADEERHQDVLAGLAQRGRDAEVMPVCASLVPCEIARGKHAGKLGLEVRVEDQRVGALTKLQADRYLPFVQQVAAAGRRAGCEAELSREPKGWHLSLLLPRVARPDPVLSAAGSTVAGDDQH